MLLDGKIDDDDTPTDRKPSKAWAITAGICGLLIYIPLNAFGMAGKGTVAAIALITLIGAVAFHLRFIDRVWFWLVIAVVTVANALVVSYVPFPNKNFVFPVVAPFGYLDYLLIALAIRSVERLVMKKQLPDVAS